MLESQKDAPDAIVMVVTTFAKMEDARQFGTTVVESQLAGCFNLVHDVTSIYQWKGKIEEDSEVIGLIKTTRGRLEDLESFLQKNHPYDEPEFLVLPVEAGSAGYLDWVRKSVSTETPLDKPAS